MSPALPSLLLAACAGRPPARPAASTLSYPQRAAAQLHLTPHEPPLAPSWLADAKELWARTTDGTCARFAGTSGLLTHELCEVERDGLIYSAYLTLKVQLQAPATDGSRAHEGGTELEVWPGPWRSVTRPGPTEIGSILGPVMGRGEPRWFLASADDTHARFETLVRAWILPSVERHPCSTASLEALAELDERARWQRLSVREDHQLCPTERHATAHTERLHQPGPIYESFPPVVDRRRTVDCTQPCPPYLGTWEPDPVYLTPGARPNPLYRDPDPEIFEVYRTEAACTAARDPGPLTLPPDACADAFWDR